MFSMQPDPIGKKIEAVIVEAIAPLVDGPDAEMELSDFFRASAVRLTTCG
jgi:hypothetical protein